MKRGCFLYTNNTLSPGELPSVRDVRWEKLDPAYARMVLISGFGFWLITGLIGLALAIAGSIPITPGFFLSAWLLLGIPTGLAYPGARVKRFAIRQADILFHEGLLWKSTTVIPRNRIQHIETENGPLERWFGLVTLKCYGAGGQQADLVIPGLSEAFGERLREHLLDRNTEAATETEATLGGD